MTRCHKIRVAPRPRGSRFLHCSGSAAFVLAAACLCWLATAAGTSAQTVMVRNLPPGTAVDISFLGTPLGGATADDKGDATLVVPPPSTVKTDTDANFFVDTCGERRAVLIVQRGFAPTSPQPGCTRQEILGVYVVKPVSTLVVNLAAAGPSILLVQGKYNPSKAAAKARAWAPVPTGFIVAAGAGLTSFRTTPINGCGNVSACTTDGSGLGFTLGAEYWFRPFLGVEATYLKPADATAFGQESTYNFKTTTSADVFTFSAKVGIPAGPVRAYGKVGTNYHRATFATTETIDDTTITVGDVTKTIPGGTQKIEAWTAGWRWQFGGGVEVWLSRRLSFFGEVGWVYLKGDQGNQGEATMKESLPNVLGGVKLVLFGRR